MASQRFPGVEGLGTGPWRKLRGDDCKRDFRREGAQYASEILCRGAHVAYEATLTWASSNAHISWRQRAGAMGGGTDANLQ